jgi:hypothetical protein
MLLVNLTFEVRKWILTGLKTTLPYRLVLTCNTFTMRRTVGSSISALVHILYCSNNRKVITYICNIYPCWWWCWWWWWWSKLIYPTPLYLSHTLQFPAALKDAIYKSGDLVGHRSITKTLVAFVHRTCL